MNDLPSFDKISDFKHYVAKELNSKKMSKQAIEVLEWAFRQGLAIGVSK